MQPTIPTTIAIALPILGQILSSLLTDDRQKPGVNAAIAAAFLLIVAILCAVLAGNFTGNLQESLLVVAAYVALLMRGSLAMLMQFFDLVPSPVANALFGPPPAQIVDSTPPVAPAPAALPPSLPPQGGAASVPVQNQSPQTPGPGSSSTKTGS